MAARALPLSSKPMDIIHHSSRLLTGNLKLFLESADSREWEHWARRGILNGTSHASDTPAIPCTTERACKMKTLTRDETRPRPETNAPRGVGLTSCSASRSRTHFFWQSRDKQCQSVTPKCHWVYCKHVNTPWFWGWLWRPCHQAFTVSLRFPSHAQLLAF